MSKCDDLSRVIVDIALPIKHTLSLDRHSGAVRIGLSGLYANRYRAYLNSGQWQYLGRFVTMIVTGEPLHKDDHVHHINGIKTDCRIDNLEVLLNTEHGRRHGSRQHLFMVRDVAGRFMPSDVPSYSEQLATVIMPLDPIPF